MPKVLGDAVGLSPLLVLVSVTTVGILFSGWAVLFAVPIAAVRGDALRRDRPRRRPRGGRRAGGDLLATRRRGLEASSAARNTGGDGDHGQNARAAARRPRHRRLLDRRLHRGARARSARRTRSGSGARGLPPADRALVARGAARRPRRDRSSTASRRAGSRSAPRCLQARSRSRSPSSAPSRRSSR